MEYISQIFIKKSMGAWSAAMSFESFYFNYENREELIKSKDRIRCVNQEGDLIAFERIEPIYLEMEKNLIENNNNFSKSVSLSKSPFNFNFS